MKKTRLGLIAAALLVMSVVAMACSKLTGSGACAPVPTPVDFDALIQKTLISGPSRRASPPIPHGVGDPAGDVVATRSHPGRCRRRHCVGNGRAAGCHAGGRCVGSAGCDVVADPGSRSLRWPMPSQIRWPPARSHRGADGRCSSRAPWRACHWATEGQVADAIASALRNQAPGLTEGDVADAISKALMDMPGMSQADNRGRGRVGDGQGSSRSCHDRRHDGGDGRASSGHAAGATGGRWHHQDSGRDAGAGCWHQPTRGERPVQLHRRGRDAVHADRRGQTSRAPMLANSFEIASDLSKATVTVQDGVMFHKGFGEMTAHDIVWSLNDANVAVTLESIHPSGRRLRGAVQGSERD